MTYKEIIYNSLILIVTQITTRLFIELDQQEDENKQYIFESINTIKDMLSETLDSTDLTCLNDIDVIFLEELTVFETLDEWQRLNSIFQIALCIEQNEELDLTADLSEDVSLFRISEVEELLKLKCFSHTNQSFVNSLAYINFSSIENIKEDIVDAQFSINLLTIFFKLLDDMGENFSGNKAYLIYKHENTSKESALSTLKVLALLDGFSIHQERIASVSASPALKDRILPSNPFHQFEETIVILSEVNGYDGLLAKFLSVYHIIENFMFKIPLANLCRNSNPSMFSVRDFRRLHDATSDKELDSIIKFFKSSDMGNNWVKQVEGMSFRDLVRSKLMNLATSVDNTKLNIILTKLDINGLNSIQDLSTGITHEQYAKLVYKVRCAVVHNKETEYHISHFNLSDESAQLIELILLQPLYSLICELLADSSSKVWYPIKELKLY